jgi:hypothetical protein
MSAVFEPVQPRPAPVKTEGSARCTLPCGKVRPPSRLPRVAGEGQVGGLGGARAFDGGPR